MVSKYLFYEQLCHLFSSMLKVGGLKRKVLVLRVVIYCWLPRLMGGGGCECCPGCWCPPDIVASETSAAQCRSVQTTQQWCDSMTMSHSRIYPPACCCTGECESEMSLVNTCCCPQPLLHIVWKSFVNKFLLKCHVTIRLLSCSIL